MKSIYDTTFCCVCQIYFYFVVAEGRERIRLCGVARDRPSPYGNEGVFFVVRGPVPRERIRLCGMARDRPSPYGEGESFFRSAGVAFFRSLASRPGGLSYRKVSGPPL